LLALFFFTAYNTAMIELTTSQRRALRARAHPLNPVVSISQKGLTATVLQEIDRCLKAHELIKIRIFDTERERRDALLAEIAAALDCVPVQHIGKLLVVWREKPAAPPSIAMSTKRKSVPRVTKRAAVDKPRRPFR
jgi:putative YhbY family RNA-binding protein